MSQQLTARARFLIEHLVEERERVRTKAPHALEAVEDLQLTAGGTCTVQARETRPSGRSIPAAGDMDELANQVQRIMGRVRTVDEGWPRILEAGATHPRLEDAARAIHMKEPTFYLRWREAMAAFKVEMIRERLA